MQTIEAPPRVITLHQNGQHVSIDERDLQVLGDVKGRLLLTMDDPKHGYDVRSDCESW